MELHSTGILSWDGGSIIPLTNLNWSSDLAISPVFVDTALKGELVVTEIENVNDPSWYLQITRKNGFIECLAVKKELVLETGTWVLTTTTLLKDENGEYSAKVAIVIKSNSDDESDESDQADEPSISCNINLEANENPSICDIVIKGIPITVTDNTIIIEKNDEQYVFDRKSGLSLGNLSFIISQSRAGLGISFAVGNESDNSDKSTVVYIGAILTQVLRDFVRNIEEISSQTKLENANRYCADCDIVEVLQSSLIVKEIDAKDI